MKKITLNLLKGLLVIVLFTGGSVVLTATGVQTVSEANAKTIGDFNGQAARQAGPNVTAAAVYQYLQNKGYDVLTVTPLGRSGKWKATVIGKKGQAILIVDAEIVNSGAANSILATGDSSL